MLQINQEQFTDERDMEMRKNMPCCCLALDKRSHFKIKRYTKTISGRKDFNLISLL